MTHHNDRPIPTRIKQAEFELIMRHCKPEADRAVLTKWYELDLNALNGQYKLLPISTHYPGFLNRAKADEFEAAETGWYATFDNIQLSLRRAVDLVPAAEPIERSRYFDSVTHDETRHGFSDVRDIDDSSTSFFVVTRGTLMVVSSTPPS